MALIDGVALTPQGDRVALTVRTADAEANRYYSHIRIVPVDGSPAKVLPAGPHIDHAAGWSPDGTQLAFLSDRSGPEQVWLTRPDGEMRRLTSFPLGVSGHPAWSPDGRRLAIVVTEEVDPGSEPAPIVAADAAPFTLTRLCYRVDGKGYLGARYQHLWIVDVETNQSSRLTDGPYNAFTPVWSPDGQRIAFMSNRVDERLPEFCSAVWVVPSAGGAAVRITPEDGVAQTPAWSPDGTELAYRGLLPGHAFARNHHLLLVSAAGDGAPRSLSGSFTGHVGGSLFSDTLRADDGAPSLFWTPGGDAVRFLAADRGRVLVFAADRSGTVTRLVEGDRACELLSVSADGKTLAYGAGDFLHAPDLYVANGDGRDERCLSRLNPWLDEKTLSQPRPLAVTNDEGATIDAWLIPPVGGADPVAGPLVLDIHGGPHSIFGYAMFFDMQLHAARGYSVLFVNPRATRSYGDEFSIRNIGKWGEGDAPDLMAALDAAITTGWIDPERIGVIGLSYGGFMTNWLIGHSDRFRVAVSENSISNLVSFHGTSDIGWYFTAAEMGAEINEDLSRYIHISPLSAVDRITIPLLLLNSMEDWRCPIEQAEQLYAALKRRGRTVEMVCFPGESHAMLLSGRPRSRLARYRHIARWFATYLKAPDEVAQS
jgi:dipeptidyl aminopeptidase/acylaminoacyl peptidase